MKYVSGLVVTAPDGFVSIAQAIHLIIRSGTFPSKNRAKARSQREFLTILFAFMMLIRSADQNDLPALMALRNWYIDHSFATFDEQHLTLRQMAQWFTQFGDGPYRCYVAVINDQIVGYCSSQAYRQHPAFRQTIETSIYVAANAGRSGTGSALYQTLFDALQDQHLHRAVVGIALPNDASVGLHEKFGFRRIGVFDEYAVKHGKRISSVWMEKSLSDSCLNS